MQREITAHKLLSPASDALTIEVEDDPGHGGANHAYCITGMNMENNPSFYREAEDPNFTPIVFQNGTLTDVGCNGVTEQALLAIVLDRLQSFQRGDFASRENALAITKIEEALHWLHHRTLDRQRRGVEGKHEK